MKKSLLALLVALPCLASSMTYAGSVVTTTYGVTSNKHTQTRAYVGLNWELGGSTTPALVLGAFQTRVKSNGDTTGANLTFSLNLVGGVKPGNLKLTALDGKEDLQGELGVGYNFLKSNPMLVLGVNAPYIAVGINGYLNPGIVPYATIHTQGKFDKPAYTCNAGDTLISSSTCQHTTGGGGG